MIKELSVFALIMFSSIVSATDILLTWTTPEAREDGTAIQSIDRYNLYTTINNVLQDVNEISGDATGFQLSEVASGNYTFQISTVEFGNEGALSDPISVYVQDKLIASPIKIKLTIEVIE